jgi:hypothetical protein
MSYYPNGSSSYYNPSIPPSSSGQYHNSYDQQHPTADGGDGTDGGAQGYGYPPRRNSYSQHQNDELFMGGDAAQQPASPSYQYHSHAQSQQQYNPQNYGSPVTQLPNPQHYGGVNRTFAPLHQPYNPALYADNTLARTNTLAHPYGFSPTSPTNASYPSPTNYQQSQFGRTASVQQHAGRSAYSPPQAPPVPAPPGSAQMPADDWSNYPTRQSSSASHAQSHYHHRTSDPHAPLPSPSTYATQDQLNRYPSTSSHLSNPLPPTPEVPPHQPLQRQDTLGRRPLPPPPPPNESESEDFFASQNDGYSQDELFSQLENMTTGAASLNINVEHANGNNHYNQAGHNGNRMNGNHLAPQNSQHVYSSDSDVEASAGLAALRAAEEQDRVDEERRRSGRGGQFGTYGSIQSPPLPNSTSPTGQQAAGNANDSDYVPVDVGLYEGNFAPHFTYGGAPDQLVAPNSHPVSSSGSQRRSEAASEDYDPVHPFPPFSTNARVDTFGTGGLEEPSARRRSYDEGDETTLMDNSTAMSGEVPDMFFHPGMSTNRPLPPPPASSNRRPHHASTSSSGSYEYWRNSQSSRGSYPADPNTMHMVSPTGTLVPRSTSLLQHSNTPQAVPLPRSKTDAEQGYKPRQQANRQTFYGGPIDSDSNTLTPGSADAVAIDLPTLPAGKRFHPAKLSSNDFKKCTEPWALSSIIAWLKHMTEGENDLKERPIREGLIALFTHKVPTMNIADAETLASRVVAEMYKVGTLVHEEEWLKFSSETMTGVIFQLTNGGCYAPKLHTETMPGRCYSHHCQRTIKKLDLTSPSILKQTADWATFYGLTKDSIEGADKKEIERQNILHEIVQGEDSYMQRLDVLRTLYRDRLITAQPPVIPPKKLNKFIKDVFSKVDAVKKANEEHLLPQMKYRQQEQGPWIVGFSDIFREWIRKAKQAYIEYSSSFPYANFLVRQEADKNMLFRTFLDESRNNKAANKLDWNTFLKGPITRLQHYGLLIDSVLKKSKIDNEEKRNLEIARDEIKAVTMECDTRVAEMTRKVDLSDLQAKLILRPGMQRVELNLDHLGRELIYKGDLMRMGGNRFTWLETHALLFDHYLVLAKTVSYREQDGVTKSEKYDVSRLPIPMDLLVLESEDDDPVIRSAVKGIAAVTPVAKSGSELRLGRGAGINGPVPGMLVHTNTSNSLSSTNTSGSGKTIGQNVNLENGRDEKIMYPFRIKHLGKETYTLFAPTAQNRAEWCDKLIIAKTNHAAALFSQNAEPFRLRVMADAAFAYESAMPSQKSIAIKGTPLDRSIDDVEKLFSNSGRPVPICRARVNCATAFNQPYGKHMVAVGTDIGVYISEYDNPRGWTKVRITFRGPRFH